MAYYYLDSTGTKITTVSGRKPRAFVANDGRSYSIGANESDQTLIDLGWQIVDTPSQEWYETVSGPVVDSGAVTFIKQDRPIDEQWDIIRSERNEKLRSSDVTQLPDYPVEATKLNEWRLYRQALRDITNQSDPKAIVWPSKPE